jgi:hypothetical protein
MDIEEWTRRAKEHEARGLSQSHAFSLAGLERRVDNWPAEWGSDLVALIYGDFQPPAQPLVFERLGITIEPNKIESTVMSTAGTVLKARVTVNDQSFPAVKDAARRLNLLVGVLSITGQGAAIRWWCSLTAPNAGAAVPTLGEGDPQQLVAMVQVLPQAVRLKLTAAMYWMRSPRAMILEQHQRGGDHFALFAGYWNAFELLVEAVEEIRPLPKFSRSDKASRIRSRLAERGDAVVASDIEALYREVVNPPLRTRAEHAIRLCTGARASAFVHDCFEHPDTMQRLYGIRNSINHGSVDIDDPEAAIIVEDRFSRLWLLVFEMFSGVLLLHFENSGR